MRTLFEELTAPLTNFLETKATQIDAESSSKSLFFSDFLLKLILAHVMTFPSLRVLVTELGTNPIVKQLGMDSTPFSTLKDGFSRFKACYFQQAFESVLTNGHWLSLPAIDELGIFQLVDGSIFPNISSMCWAEYKKTKNAIRLHLSFELNRMIPTEFITTAANESERSFLEAIIRKGVTYIADRGYFRFHLGAKIAEAKAFFIFRIKANIKFGILKDLVITSHSAQIPACFTQLTDQLIRFENDPNAKEYRLIRFRVLDSEFSICTNRMELTTLEIIMLYAYRWQVELLFKFIKRTLNGIHLFNLSPNGVSIHFYALMTTALLELRLRQICRSLDQITQNTQNTQNNEQPDQQGNQERNEGLDLKEMERFSSYRGYQPDTWIKNITDQFYTYWKIGLHWLINLKNLIAQRFDFEVIRILGGP